MKTPHSFSAKSLNDEIFARLLKDDDRCAISKCFSGNNHCGWNVSAPRYLWIKAGVHPVWLSHTRGYSLQTRVGTKRMKRARELLLSSLDANESISFTQPLPAQVFHFTLNV
ncbi:hypothetical protein [Enterobacter sp.]|uniref:hypothetical protein n=1 Tax=Enterobacter sp. TaxID=42895 RepID=UPI00296E4B6F|nr:hypothetical protein [Enterobacter sp.]